MLQAEEATNASHDIAQELVTDSLMAGYLEAVNSRTDTRRVLRAILTDGVNQKPLNEFPEVWENETKERKLKDGTSEPQKKLDLEKGEFGDYNVDEDDDEVMEDAPTAANDTSQATKGAKDPFQLGIARFGGVDAVSFRQRLLALVRDLICPTPLSITDAGKISCTKSHSNCQTTSYLPKHSSTFSLNSCDHFPSHNLACLYPTHPSNLLITLLFLPTS